MNLQIFGYALRMRWLWQKRSMEARSWHALPDAQENIVEQMFFTSTYVEVGDGRKALFWSDCWLQGQSIMQIAPCLFNAVGPRIKKKRTVSEALHGDRWTRDITGALTVQVILDYLHIWDLTRDIHLDADQRDRICWKWTPDRQFSTSSAYSAFFIGQHPTEGAKILHKTRVPAKCKFFIWLVLHERCWTAERCKRHGLQDDDTCVLCDQESETITHLLINCSYSRQVWFSALRRLGWENAAPSSVHFSLAEWWCAARKRLQKEDRKAFDTLTVLICWLLWKERNNRTFDHSVHTIQETLVKVTDEITYWLLAGFRRLQMVAHVLGSDVSGGGQGRAIVAM